MEIIGGISGAALGFIGGNLRGAKLGYQYGKTAGKNFSKMAPLSKKRKAESTAETNKKQKLIKALKKTLKKRPALKKKLRAMAKKKMKVSRKQAKKIGSIVQKTLDKNVAICTYRKNYFMDQKVVYDKADFDLYIVGGQRGGANSGIYGERSLSFTPLSVPRIVDAASVLWNGKTVTLDAYVETGNFNASRTTIHCVYASAKYEIYNHATIAFDIEVIEVTAKDTNEATSFMKTVDNEISLHNISAYNFNSPALFVDSAGNNEWAVTKGVEFTDITSLSDSYSWKTVKRKRLRRGEIMKFGYKISDRKIDLSEFSHGEGGQFLADYCRGDKQIILKVTPQIHSMSNTTGGQEKHLQGTYETFDAFNNGLAIHCKEIYRIAQPNNTLDANEGNKTVIFSDEPIRTTVQQGGTMGAGAGVKILNAQRENPYLSLDAVA